MPTMSPRSAAVSRSRKSCPVCRGGSAISTRAVTTGPSDDDPFFQNAAWQVAEQLGGPDTFDAEYVALTQLEADALITLDRQLADAVKD